MPGILAKALDDQVAAFHSDLAAKLARYDTECSVVVALARGGPRGASMPLPPPPRVRLYVAIPRIRLASPVVDIAHSA